MLEITIPKTDLYDETNNRFITFNGQELVLEHSLKSVSTWEQKYHKTFMSDNVEKTNNEIIDYIRCMTLSDNVDPVAYQCLTRKLLADIFAYMDNPMSAYKFTRTNNYYRYGSITAEVIYHRMLLYGIPFSCENWHLNRLLALISYCSNNSGSGNEKKMSATQLARYNSKLNQQRRQLLHTKG